MLLVSRRQLGQASAFAVFGHVLSQAPISVILTDPGDFRFWGSWGLVFIIPLFITSNDFSVRLLKRNWKRLQWLIHPLYIFAMIHYALQKGPLGLLLIITTLVILYTLRFLVYRKQNFKIL